LEYLETQGVPVIGYQTDELPAFYTRQSGFRLVHRAETPEEIAEMLKIKWDLNLSGGVVIANPIPVEFAMDYNYISLSIEDALEKAKDLGIRGKDTTPYLLSEIKRKTHGESLEANIQLVFNNAKLGAKLACALAALK
jgi:pseudouridine-5'-phosphate glycosidase